MLVHKNNNEALELEKEVKNFISVLENKTRSLGQWTEKTKAHLAEEGLEVYLTFRNIVLECESFLEVVQRRVDRLKSDGHENKLQSQLDDLTVKQLTLATQASLHFLRCISNKDLPLGSREFFARELIELRRMQEILNEDRLKGRVAESALADQHKVAEILDMVIEKAPDLFEF